MSFDGRPLPTISDLVVSHMTGTPEEKLAWLLRQKAAGLLDADDPDEIAQAEAMLLMLARLSVSTTRRQHRQHLDQLLDQALQATFPASDPVSVGHFTSTEAPGRPIDTTVVDRTSPAKARRRRTPRRRRAA
jgi:hypothetical protein